jgi:hypothetical protein
MILSKAHSLNQHLESHCIKMLFNYIFLLLSNSFMFLVYTLESVI